MGNFVCDRLYIYWQMESPKATLLESCWGTGWEVYLLQLSWAGAVDDRCGEWRSSLLPERAGTVLWIFTDGSFCYQETLDFSQVGN